MGICSLRDLLYTLPNRYEDRTAATPIEDAPDGPVLLSGVIGQPPKLNRFNGMTRVSAILQDDTGRIPLTWFNQPWMKEQLPAGKQMMLYGRITTHNGFRSMTSAEVVKELCIRPVYRQIRGFQPKSFRNLMEEALAHVDELSDPLPEYVLQLHGLVPLATALRQAHFPDDMMSLKEARRRLAFEQMLLYFAVLGSRQGQKQPGQAIEICDGADERFWSALPFPATGAQRRVLRDIIGDLGKDKAMSRLVQGDVGCGKTAIAFGSIALCCQAGFQCAMMAPTEILAQQHYESARTML